jgi:hypothetical protein
MNWQIEFRHDPLIHPEDAARAICARMAGSQKHGGEKATNEDMFIAGLVNSRPWNQQQVEQLMELSIDKNFCERLARAFETGKKNTWDGASLFILRNWRELRFRPEIQKMIEAQDGKLPGLQDWSPLAIEGLFELGKIETDCEDGSFDDWFRKRRARLGLRANASYQIKKFIVKGDVIQVVR